MERNVAEYLVHLKENASELRKLGKEWGITEKEIDGCVTEALAGIDDKESLKSSPKNNARKCWGYFLVALKLMMLIFVVLILIFGIFSFLMSYHEPTQEVMVKLISPYFYYIMRYARLAAVPLHGMFNMTDLYREECLVYNPLYVGEPTDCTLCSNFKAVKEKNLKNFTEVKFGAYSNIQKPVKIVKTLDRNVTYKDLKDMYQNIDGGLIKDQHEFVKKGDNNMSLNDFFINDYEELVNTSSTLQVHWITRSVKASAALRKLFPRPPYIPVQSEIALEKVVVVDGPNSGPHQLPQINNGQTHLFIVGSGHRRVLVRPVDECRQECNNMLVFMEAGDTLIYSPDLFRLFLGVNSEEPMVGYILQT
ncbi:hypothetical protein ACF0H5_016055 [Mactra antiquata]